MPSLKELSFHASGVTTIVADSFGSRDGGSSSLGIAADLKVFDLSHVPLNCDCDAAWLRDPSFNGTNAVCLTPKEAHGLRPADVPPGDAAVFSCRGDGGGGGLSSSTITVVVIVAGAVFGLLVVVLVVVTAVWLVRRRRNRRSRRSDGEDDPKNNRQVAYVRAEYLLVSYPFFYFLFFPPHAGGDTYGERR